MSRYIDVDKFKQQLESAIEKLHLIGGIKGVDVGAVIKAIDMQPTADVVPRSVIAKIFAEIEEILNSACKRGYCGYISDLIAELKKKYVEE